MEKITCYTVQEWSPQCAGDVVAEVEFLHQAEEAARACYQAQITSPAWGGGYVTTWAEGGASAKYFRGHDASGFGGEIPEDAATLAARLEENRAGENRRY
ncbi:MAG: hypothetical protein RBQ99_01620 [Trichlorobacter sp.]|nr:hypothetical protein [Trichlorobacter sp.]